MAAKKQNKEATVLPNPFNEEMVSVMLHKDDNKNRGNLYVAVNAYEFRVPRGVAVQVPVSVAEIIQNKLAQENEIMESQVN